MLPKALTISSVVVESRTALTFETSARIGAAPGQFVMVWLPGVDEKPFSVMSDSPFSLTIAEVGPFTERLQSLKAGDPLHYRGPFGKGFVLDDADPLVVVGGGCGAIPIHFLAEVARARGRQVVALLGARTADDLLLVERFRGLGCQVSLATEDGSAGQRGLVTGLLEEAPKGCPVYACGPEPMLAAVAAWCAERGVEGQFSLERYMKCGIGVCGQCALDDRLVCSDGPVFTGGQLRGMHDFGRWRRDAAGRRVALGGNEASCPPS